MQLEREWESDEARAAFARELRGESLVWAKVLVEHSPTAERLDPLALMRCAFGEAIDEGWGGRNVDLLTYASGGVNDVQRVPFTRLVGPALRIQLERPGSGGTPGLGAALRQSAGRAVGPDLIVILGSSRAKLGKQLPKGAVDSRFLIGTLGCEPAPELAALAAGSGGTAMAVRDEADARFLGSLLCTAYLALAKTGAGRVAARELAEQHYDNDSSIRTHAYSQPYREPDAPPTVISCAAYRAGTRGEYWPAGAAAVGGYGTADAYGTPGAYGAPSEHGSAGAYGATDAHGTTGAYRPPNDEGRAGAGRGPKHDGSASRSSTPPYAHGLRRLDLFDEEF